MQIQSGQIQFYSSILSCTVRLKEFCTGVSYSSIRSGFSRTPTWACEKFPNQIYNMMINVNCFYLNESSYYRIHVKGLVLKITSERASLLSSLLTHSVGTTFSPGLFENFVYVHSLNHFWVVELHKRHSFF